MQVLRLRCQAEGSLMISTLQGPPRRL